MNSYTRALALCCATLLLAFTGVASAATIQSWNIDDVVTDSAPYTDLESYNSSIYDTTNTMDSYGGVTWKERDTQAPGLSIVNNDDVNGSNCIMCAGYNPFDLSIKQCSDPFQSSKRFKLFSTDNQPLYLEFNVVASANETYRVLQKYSNYSPTRWQDYTVELGFLDANGNFIPSQADDGLGFCNSKGQIYTSPVLGSSVRDRDLSALFSQGLFGAPDKNHPEAGYFNPTTRASFEMTVSEDAIVSSGISASYGDIFGQWLNEEDLPTGIFWDDDADPDTDNVLMANCEGQYDAVNGICNGTWVTYRSYPGVVNGQAGVGVGEATPVPQAILDEWAAQSDLYLLDFIDDLANLGLTYHIQLGDNSQWPTPDSFVIRFNPVPVAN